MLSRLFLQHVIAEKVRLLSASTGVTEARILTAVLSDDNGGGGGGGAATLAALQEVCWGKWGRHDTRV